MRFMWLVVILMSVILTGCASPGIDEVRLKQLETELKAEFRGQIEVVRQEFKEEMSDGQQGIRSDIKAVSDTVQMETAEIKSAHEKDNIDLQKQFFSNKRLIEDQAKRIYLIESIVTAKPAVSAVKENEGFVTSVDGVNMEISLGKANNVNAGDLFSIYKGDAEIASGRVIKAEANSSEAMVISKEAEISVGDSIRPE